MTARRIGKYTFVRSGREVLYRILDVETKYKARNLDDVPVWRGGDGLAAHMQGQLQLQGEGVGSSNVAPVGAAFAAA